MTHPSQRTVDAGNYPIHIGPESGARLAAFVRDGHFSQVFVLTDDHTATHCWPRWEHLLPAAHHLSIPHGEPHKSLATCATVWQALTDRRADRKALLVNVGGGLVGDLGGFSAACYKRGIDFVQAPTSLLAMVDASAGGKTGVNFDHYKNQVGAFRDPRAVFIEPAFLETLPPRELRSGFAELLKHALIARRDRWEPLATARAMPTHWTDFIAESIQIKVDIVTEDPFERGARKALNFGHTIGHAAESYFMTSDPLLHGEAVALGMVCEAFISEQRGLLSPAERHEIDAVLQRIFGHRALPEAAFPDLLQLTRQDKKNQGGEILCTLLDGIGAFRINQALTPAEIEASFHHYNSLS